METIRYGGRNVYTHSNRDTTQKDLERAGVETDQIEDVYFFTVDGDNQVNKIGFDRLKVESNQSGLMVDVKGRKGCASIAVAGLSRIVDFMTDAKVLGKDLAILKGRPITTYNKGICLIGISPR